MYNVVMFIRYYTFLSLIYLIQANCEKQLFEIPIRDDDCVGRKSPPRYKIRASACRGFCQSASVNTHYTVIDSTSVSVKPVTSCKCCHALSYTTRIFQAKCKKNRPLKTKTFVVHSAKECGCKSCGPDFFEYQPMHPRSIGKRKRSRSSGLFLDSGEFGVPTVYDNDYNNDRDDTDNEEHPSIVEIIPTDYDEDEEDEGIGQITNYKDSDVLR